MAKRSPGLEPAGNLIQKSIGALGEKMDRLYRTHYALGHLSDLIGSAFAEHIHPLGVSHKKLFVYVPEDAWRSEIWMYREEIIRRINRCAGEEIVREIVSTYKKKMKDADQKNQQKTYDTGSDEGPSVRAELRRVNLTDEEIGKLRTSCQTVQNEEIRKKLFSLSIKRKKLEKLRKKKNWHPCPGCGVLCPPEEGYCAFCSLKERKKVRTQIRSILSELPWLRYPEIKKSVPCTPDIFESVRDEMLQRLASRVYLEDADSLDSHILVMLYLHVPPEQITDDMVKRTLYRLRNDLAKPKEFKPYKRYDIIPLGRKKGRKEEISHVPSSRK